MRLVWLTYEEAAARAGVSVRQVRRWRAAGLRGRIDSTTGRWYVDELSLMRAAQRWMLRRSRFSSTVQPNRPDRLA